MGTRPAEIEREIAQQREDISRRVSEMRQRGSDDVQDFSSRLGDTLNSSVVKQTVEERPMLTVAGALALGVALGMASESVSLRGIANRAKEGARQTTSAGGGLMGAVSGFAADELKSLLEGWLSERRPSNDRPERRDTGPAIRDQTVIEEQEAVGGLV
jgi:hypothetical protein